MPAPRCWSSINALFQSAPDREVGRCLPETKPSNIFTRFNPRPTVRSGDALSSPPFHPWAKSFNPRPTVRSGDAHFADVVRVEIECFNPRPTVRSGDA